MHHQVAKITSFSEVPDKNIMSRILMRFFDWFIKMLRKRFIENLKTLVVKHWIALFFFSNTFLIQVICNAGASNLWKAVGGGGVTYMYSSLFNLLHLTTFDINKFSCKNKTFFSFITKISLLNHLHTFRDLTWNSSL